MNSTRKLLVFIFILALGAGFFDLPKEFSVKTKLGKWEIDKTINVGEIDFNLGPWRIKKPREFKLGLDLAGGTHLVLQAEMKDVATGDRNTALESAKEIIERRINLYGVSEPVIQTSKAGGDYRIIIELPGVKDVKEAIDLIGKTAVLEFREQEEGTSSSQIATESARIYGPYTKLTGLSGKHLSRAAVVFGQQTGKPEVSLEFNSEGAKLFEEITRRNVNKPVAIFLDQQIISAPRVNEEISGGRAVINGEFTTEEAKNMAIELNAGALPVGVKVIEQRSVGATLGQESVRKSIIAGLIGLGLVGIFMIGNYGKLGILADIALLIYTMLSLAVFKFIPVTLTLAGIAGFILSIGMAVDANILIFERIKEESRQKRPMVAAMEIGFQRAFPSIRDSNVSSLITCGILYYFGSGTIRGFALTLAVGILISLFTAITVTHTFLRATTRNNKL